MNPERVTVLVGPDAVTLKVKGEGTVRVGMILGRKTLDDGSQRIWVDRRLHDRVSLTLPDGTHLSGAVSTLVTLPPL